MWAEITQNLSKRQQSFDRPDLIVIAFRQKFFFFMNLLKKGVFGPLQAWLYSVEFQKRGFPHVHAMAAEGPFCTSRTI